MKTWADISSIQPLVGKIITNSIQKARVSHAYLLSGERGTGKSVIAEQFAKSIFCLHRDGVEPCHTCHSCKRIESGNHPDVHWIEPDGLSIKKEQIDYLQKEFVYAGMESNKKVYVIKSAETLTLNAANRLLKFLEEPSQETTAILLTDNAHAMIRTIRSRCQVLELKPLNPGDFQAQLREAGISETNTRLFSALTNNLDEALRWSQDDWFATARKLMLQLIERLKDNPDDAYLFIHSQWLPHFKDRDKLAYGMDLLILAFKDILMFHIGYDKAFVVFDKQRDSLDKFSLAFSMERLQQILGALLEAKQKLNQNVHQTLVMEQLTLQIER